MSRKKIVAGNWKMNSNLNEASNLLKNILSIQKENREVERIIFPPFLFLKELADILKNESNFYIGAQNCSQHAKGAYTGEVSAEMIHSVGCRYVLIGHSERRAYFNESTEDLKAKINQALAQNLKIIFCFGEKLDERKNYQHFITVEKQLADVLKDFPNDKTQNLVLAYEPVWAIGTGETATPQQAQEMHAFVREKTTQLFSKEVANSMSVLYGGSCNAQNAGELFACKDVDGGLIGGASLKAEDFCKIVQSF